MKPSSGRDIVDSTPYQGSLTADFLLKAVSRPLSMLCQTNALTTSQLIGGVNRRMDSTG